MPLDHLLLQWRLDQLYVCWRLHGVWSMLDSQLALQTQSGRAESRTDNALELLLWCRQSMLYVITHRLPRWVFDGDCPWNWGLYECQWLLSLAELRPQVLSAKCPTIKGYPLLYFYACMDKPLFLLLGLELPIQQLTGHMVAIHPDDVCYSWKLGLERVWLQWHQDFWSCIITSSVHDVAFSSINYLSLKY